MHTCDIRPKHADGNMRRFSKSLLFSSIVWQWSVKQALLLLYFSLRCVCYCLLEIFTDVACHACHSPGTFLFFVTHVRMLLTVPFIFFFCFLQPRQCPSSAFLSFFFFFFELPQWFSKKVGRETTAKKRFLFVLFQYTIFLRSLLIDQVTITKQEEVLKTSDFRSFLNQYSPPYNHEPPKKLITLLDIILRNEMLTT